MLIYQDMENEQWLSHHLVSVGIHIQAHNLRLTQTLDEHKEIMRIFCTQVHEIRHIKHKNTESGENSTTKEACN